MSPFPKTGAVSISSEAFAGPHGPSSERAKGQPGKSQQTSLRKHSLCTGQTPVFGLFPGWCSLNEISFPLGCACRSKPRLRLGPRCRSGRYESLWAVVDRIGEASCPPPDSTVDLGDELTTLHCDMATRRAAPWRLTLAEAPEGSHLAEPVARGDTQGSCSSGISVYGELLKTISLLQILPIGLATPTGTLACRTSRIGWI